MAVQGEMIIVQRKIEKINSPHFFLSFSCTLQDAQT